MPLPDRALTIQGGCNCRAIRYKISIPEVSERPIHPFFIKPESLSIATKGDSNNKTTPPPKLPHFPMSAICHCNDYRRATGALLNYWFCSPISYVELSLLPLPEVNKDAFTPLQESSKDASSTTPSQTNAPFISAAQFFPLSPKTKLATYLDMLDILLGTVDRTDLETE
ncbi:hypothetical protein G7Y89_g3434 [Cudoniella acicularis]|uniref:Uncharacterized protein n=1 Tax=Cudoniella acicularis TaxID=354080 RepID=A0A8H4RSN7_9HELO|nr:hypothetical protein G7Y89_g3434 [Cudoniella acicularis]